MEIGQLEAFERAARLGSFSAAAEEMNLSQPAVSKRITTLEAVIGGALFERTGTGLELTDLGSIFLPYVTQSLSTLRQGREMARRFQQGLHGEVRFGSLDVPAMYFLPDPIRRFRRAYPSVDLSCLVLTAAQILRALHAGRMDVALIGTRVLDKRIVVLARFLEPIAAIAAPTHPLAQLAEKQGDVSVSDLYQHTIFRVTLNRDVTDIVEQIVEQAREGSGGAVVWINGLLAVDLLVEGQGVAFLPENAVKKELDEGALVRLPIRDLHDFQNELLIVRDSQRQLDTPTQAFVDMICHQWRHIRVT